MALGAHTVPLLREQAFIDGEWCDADDGATFAVHNPATGELLGDVPRMGAAETRRAIDDWVETRYLSLGGIDR